MIRMQGTPNQTGTGLAAYLGRMGGIRILFVEDDQFYRENLVAELTERGFVVHSFTDATWLLHSLDRAVEADVIVLEWKLPKTSGIDLLLQLRQRGVG
jgi:DNA-binding response OmpR family regulator